MKKEERKSLYSLKDSIGHILSQWRNRSVFPHIKGRLIDLACGRNSLVSRYKNGVGVDIFDYGGKDTIVLKSLFDTPFEDEAFDTATMVASLNYFDEPLAVLRETNRILKKDGQLIITMPEPKAIKLWNRKRPLLAHRLYYERDEIDKMLNSSGFNIIEQRNFMLGLNKIFIAKKVL